MWWRSAICAAAMLLPTLRLAAQNAAMRTETRLGPGLTHVVVHDPRGPWVIHVVRIDLRTPGLDVRVAHARDSLKGRERTSSIAARHSDSTARVRVAVNADFFDLKTGASENNQVDAGEWWKGLMVTESPYDTYDNVHAQFALSGARRGAVDRYVLDGRVMIRRGTASAPDANAADVPVLSVNALPTGAYEATALYTPRFGATTPRDIAPRDSVRKVGELPLRQLAMRRDTLVYLAAAEPVSAAGTAIPADGAVLAAYGDRAGAWAGVHTGDTVRVVLRTLPELPGGRSPTLLVGGWPRLLQNGENVARQAAIREGTISKNAEARHPRTAIGVSKDGRTLWLMAVDGRSVPSVGMTTTEEAEYLRTLGAWNALNFDGGGSTTMVIDGRVVNTPTDAAGEREIGNALLVLERTVRAR